MTVLVGVNFVELPLAQQIEVALMYVDNWMAVDVSFSEIMSEEWRQDIVKQVRSAMRARLEDVLEVLNGGDEDHARKKFARLLATDIMSSMPATHAYDLTRSSMNDDKAMFTMGRQIEFFAAHGYA